MQDLMARMVLYLLPMYFANSMAMVFGGKTPIDFGVNFVDGKPLFGRGKTFKGALAGIIAGTAIAAALAWAFPGETKLLSENFMLLGFLLSAGAIAGDMTGSFLKRRLGLEQGREVLFLDQLDFVAGAFVLGALVYVPTLLEIVAISVVTLIIHRASNYIAFKAKLKKVPW